jgi:hypothetical protein
MPKKENPMARLIEREFDPARPVYARKYFTAAGRKYVPGDLFDWSRLAVSQRRALQMFDAGKLAHKTEDTPERIKEEYTPKSIEEEFEDAEILSIASGDDLDAIDDMKELRRIADGIGAPYKVSKKDQREAIREHKEMSE